MAIQYKETQAIVSRPPVDGKRQWNIENVRVAPPAEDEVLVEMVASGVCHTDLGCGSDPDGSPGFPVPPYPRVLGHEGAGHVRSVGSKITKVKVGDSVLLSFAFCTQCHNCQYGAPGYCKDFAAFNFVGNNKAFVSSKGEDVGGSFFGQSSFARLARVKQTSVVKVTNMVQSKEELKLLAPLGCGIQTGAGTITELASAKPSDTVAIIGLGGVGLAAVMGAKVRGCRKIIGIDRVPGRLEMAKSLGATDCIDTTKITGTLIQEVWKVTGGTGTTITVDATGVVSLIQQGVEFTANQGKMILLGVAPMDAGLQVAIVPYMTTGKHLLGSMEGGVYPEKYIPDMMRWYRSGNFPVQKLVKFYPVKEFHRAIEDMENGETIKPVLIW